MRSNGAFIETTSAGVDVVATTAGGAFRILGLVATLASLIILIVGSVAIAAFVAWPVTQYHDFFVENAESFQRGTLKPLWVDDVRDFVDLVREAWNALICWWNGLGAWIMGMIREVLVPTIFDCGVTPFFRAVFVFVRVVAQDMLVYVLGGGWTTEPADFSRITPAGIALSEEWIRLYTCSCSDLGEVIGRIPITSPLLIVPPLVLFSEQWTYPETWAAIEAAVNAAAALGRQAYELSSQVLNFAVGNVTPGQEFKRPDLRPTAGYLVDAVFSATRSTERAYQNLWDAYVPFTLDWTGFLGVVDQGAAVLIRGVALILHASLHVDRVVSYPQDTYLELVIRRDLIEVANLIAEPTQFADVQAPAAPAPAQFFIRSYYLDPASDSTPQGEANPVFGRQRLEQGVCALVTRIICDPSNGGGICFATNTQHLLFGFDFCCVTTDALRGIVDSINAAFEAVLAVFRGLEGFIFFLDSQPFTTIVLVGAVDLARCLLSIVTLIPAVGPALRDLLVAVASAALNLLDFGIRTGIGLASLPYYFLANPGVNNFITEPNRALAFWERVIDEIVADSPESAKNTLCALLNSAFPIPPITCSSCRVGGFVEVTGNAKRQQPLRMFSPDGTVSPVDMFRRTWGLAPDESQYHITPLIYYHNHTTNPFELYNRLYVNVQTMDADVLPFRSLRDVDSYVDKRKAETLLKWEETKSCRKRQHDRIALKHLNPRLYEQKLRSGEMRETETCSKYTFGPLQYREPEQHKRLELGELEPTLVDCSPTPECFDVCCLARSILELVAHSLQATGRFFNGLVNYSAASQGTLQDFPYFTGEFATMGKATFDGDLIQAILLLFRPVKCVCQVLNQILPVPEKTYTEGRPDLCCFIQRVSEGIACIVQVFINAVNSLAMGKTTNFAYFRTGLFRKDMDTLFDVALEIVRCACIFLEATFPLNFIPGFADAIEFDPCCAVAAVLNTFIEIARGIVQVIITLATITIDDSSFCYWRLDQTVDRMCGGTLDEIGVVKQLDIIIDSFLPQHSVPVGTKNPAGEWRTLLDGSRIWISLTNPTSAGGACFENCNVDNGATGIVPCICQIFNSLIPFRARPNEPVSCVEPLNCQELDFCCFFGKAGFFLADLAKFLNRMLVAAWQPWADNVPEFLVNYLWCVEETVQQCPQLRPVIKVACDMVEFRRIPECEGVRPIAIDSGMMTIVHRCGEFTCGRFNIVIANLVDPFNGFFSKCFCELFNLLDMLLFILFEFFALNTPITQSFWACCFCGGYDPDARGGRGFCSARAVNPCEDGTGFNNGRINEGRLVGSGILPAASYIVNAVLQAVIRLIRGFPFLCYWRPFAFGDQEGQENFVPRVVAQTWIFSFLAPTANALCIATGNTVCIATSFFLLPNTCLVRGSNFVGSIIRWIAEIILRVVAFIEAFVATLIRVPNTCVGELCDQNDGSKIQSSKGLNAKELGDMLVILLSIPIDILIGDSRVACSTVCRPLITAAVKPGPCECWNRSPRYAAGIIPEVYTRYVATDPLDTMCDDPDASPVVIPNDAGGYLFTAPGGRKPIWWRFQGVEENVGCCRRSRVIDGRDLPEVLPVCQNPDDQDGVAPEFRPLGGFQEVEVDGQEYWYPSGYPGSCVWYSACRADALPNCAGDLLTPVGLSRNYQNSIDGLAMGFVRYLRCLLDHLFTCNDGQGSDCNPDLQFGIIFYPAIVIFSLLWQILGGVIKFAAALGIFTLSLFQPSDTSDCGCYEAVEIDGFGDPAPRFRTRVDALCYPCRTLRHDCSQGPDFTPTGTGGGFVSHYRCRDYCPAQQLLNTNNTITPAEALSRCIADYQAFGQKANGYWTPYEICTGTYNWPPVLPDNQARMDAGPVIQQCWVEGVRVPANDQPWPNINVTGTGRGQGWCKPIQDADPSLNRSPYRFCDTDAGFFVQLDMCPNPTCQNNIPGNMARVENYNNPNTGDDQIENFWPCGGFGNSLGDALFDNNYPRSPLILCGAIALVQNLQGLFNSFTDIFTVDIFIPSNDAFDPLTGKRSEQTLAHAVRSFFESNRTTGGQILQILRQRPVGPVQREPRAVWSARVRARRVQEQRWEGTMYHPSAARPTFVQELADAMWEYDVSDCYEDPVACACRNLDMPHHCHVDLEGRLRYAKRYNDTMSTCDLTNVMADEMFRGTTVCDHVVKDCANKTWEEIHPEAKNQWVKCVERYIQGSRMHEVMEYVPTDIMYNEQAPKTLFHNLLGAARVKTGERARHTRQSRLPMSKRFAQKFPRWKERIYNQTKLARKVLEEHVGIYPKDMMYDAIVKAYIMQYKYDSGYYSFLLQEGVQHIVDGNSVLPDPHDAAQELRRSIRELGHVIWNQPYAELAVSTAHVGRMAVNAVTHVFNRGVLKFAGEQWNRHAEYREARIGDAVRAKRERIWRTIRSSPIYKWWYSNNTVSRRPSAFAPFIAHVRAVMKNNRTYPRAVWNADVQWHSMREVLVDRWRRPQWTPEKLHNWEKLGRVYYRLKEYLQPGSVTELEPHKAQRFLYNGSCLVIDRTVDLTMRLVDYCANDALINMRDSPRLSNEARQLGAYLDDTSPYREGSYRHWARKQQTPYLPRHADPKAWLRPRLVLPNKTDDLRLRVDRRVYRRAVTMERRGPAGWNFQDWLTCFVEDVTGWMLGAQTDSWLDTVRAWILNPNTDVQSYPDVGLAYWIRFEFRCPFPEATNCSIGDGLEYGILWTLVAVAAMAVLGSYFFPLATLPLQAIGYPIAALGIFGAIAYHWSLWCLLTGSLPMCLADDLVAFADKWFTRCLSPLVIPTYMIAGDVCPADPNQMIDFISCKDIGVSDGIQNWLFLMVWVFGDGVVRYLLQISTFLVGWWFPAATTYAETTLNWFADANETNMKRMTFCFWVTLPSMVLPAMLLVVAGNILATLVPVALEVARSLIFLLFASPAGPGGGGWYAERAPYAPAAPLPTREEQQPGILESINRRLFFGTPTPTAAELEKKNQ